MIDMMLGTWLIGAVVIQVLGEVISHLFNLRISGGAKKFRRQGKERICGGGGSLTRLTTVQSHSLLNLPLSKSHLTSLQIILADTKYPMPLPQQEQGGGQGNSSSTSFTGQSRGYAGFLLCCSWTAARGLGVQLGPSQSLYLCPCTTPSLNCHLSSSTSKAQLSPGFGSPKTLSDFLGPTQPCAFPPSLGEPDGSCFNNRIGLKPRARLSPLTKFEVRLGLLL